MNSIIVKSSEPETERFFGNNSGTAGNMNFLIPSAKKTKPARSRITIVAARASVFSRLKSVLSIGWYFDLDAFGFERVVTKRCHRLAHQSRRGSRALSSRSANQQTG